MELELLEQEEELLLPITTPEIPKKSYQSQKIFTLSFIASGLLLFIIFYSYPYLLNIISNLHKSTKLSSTVWLDFCDLPDADPWDSSINNFFKPEKDHMLNCTPKYFEYSKLINGQLFVYAKDSSFGIDCKMRCILPKNDWNVTLGDWVTIVNGTKPKCDVVEIECTEKDGTIIYNFLHAQVYRDNSPVPAIPTPPKKYDVHIMVIDSVGQTQFIRSMPKTLHILRENYEAIPFQYLNKIGINSRPNGFAFLFGKQIYDIPASPFSKGHARNYNDVYAGCYTPLDDDQFIGFRYKDDGYATMMAEDWEEGISNYPGCIGFTKPPMDHYMKPFQRHVMNLKNHPNLTFYNNSCHEPHFYIGEYLKSFLKVYPDKPKFSMTWMTTVAHHANINSLSSSDDYFYRFFNDTQNDFENSFIFFMSDHGLRYGEFAKTSLGEIEDDNPFFFLSIPKPLRSNPKLMTQLRKNSKELITPFDIYTTMVELVQPRKPRIPKPIILGHSLLHPLPYPRTCDSLRIPFEYCLCRVKRILLPENNAIGFPAARLMVKQINSIISTEKNLSKMCSKLSLNESAKISVEDYGGEQAYRVYKVIFSTTPGNGRFWGVASFNPLNSTFQIPTVTFDIKELGIVIHSSLPKQPIDTTKIVINSYNNKSTPDLTYADVVLKVQESIQQFSTMASSATSQLGIQQKIKLINVLPKFSGKPNESFQEFCKTLGTRLKTFGIDYETAIELFPVCLEGNAAEKFLKITIPKLEDNKTHEDRWKEMLMLMAKSLAKPYQHEIAFEKLNARKRDMDEDLDMYMNEIKHLVMQAYSSNYTKEQRQYEITKYFVRGLNNPLKEQLMRKRIQDPDELLMEAHLEEELQKQIKREALVNALAVNFVNMDKDDIQDEDFTINYDDQLDTNNDYEVDYFVDNGETDCNMDYNYNMDLNDEVENDEWNEDWEWNDQDVQAQYESDGSGEP